MFTTLHIKVRSYKVNKDNKHPAFIERGGLKDIVEDIKSELIKALPHGSGINYDWTVEQGIDWTFKCYNAFQAMDSNGYYCGAVRFEVIVDIRDLEVVSIETNKQDIEDIYKEYETEEEDPDDLYDNPCPYLDDLDDDLCANIEMCFEYYVLEETLKYTKEVHPWIFDRYVRNN